MQGGASECVKWNQLSPCLAAVFLGNAVFSLVLVIVVSSKPNTTQSQSIHIDNDPQKSQLIETLARETISAELHNTTGGIRSGSSH